MPQISEFSWINVIFFSLFYFLFIQFVFYGFSNMFSFKSLSLNIRFFSMIL